MSRPTLSLCMIVKDEEQFLPDCLASVRSVVDELVIADTGSTDRTTEIAREHGAKLVRHAWDDDFAAARNAALAAATGSWILVLDADERLAEGAGQTIHTAIRRGGFDLGMLPLHNARTLETPAADVLAGPGRFGIPVHVPRLLRHRDGLRWSGVVHEGIGDWLREIHGVSQAVAAPIIHYGGVPSHRDALGKRERNVSLLRRRCALDPDDHLGRYFLAVELIGANRPVEALEVAAGGWEIGQRLRVLWKARGQRPFGIDAIGGVYAEALLGTGRIEEARRVVDAVIELGTTHPNVHWIAANLAELESLHPDPATRAARLQDARGGYTAALANQNLPTVIEVAAGLTTWRSEERLAMVLQQLGLGGAAELAWERCRKDAPDPQPASLGLAELALDRGDVGVALAALDPLLALGGADAWILAALCAESLGLDDDLAELLQIAANTPGRPRALHRLARFWGLELRVALRAGFTARGIELGPAGPVAMGPPGCARSSLPMLSLSPSSTETSLLLAATRRDPFDPLPWQLLAGLCVSLGLGDLASACRQLPDRVAPQKG